MLANKSSNIPQIIQYEVIQSNISDEMDGAASGVALVVRAYKVILIGREIICGTKVQLCITVRTIQQTREQTFLTCFGCLRL